LNFLEKILSPSLTSESVISLCVFVAYDEATQPWRTVNVTQSYDSECSRSAEVLERRQSTREPDNKLWHHSATNVRSAMSTHCCSVISVQKFILLFSFTKMNCKNTIAHNCMLVLKLNVPYYLHYSPALKQLKILINLKP